MFRYRRMSWNEEDELRIGGDYTWGQSERNYLVDSPTAVAQAVLTRLKLWQGEWFLNLQEGVPYLQQILGHPPGANVPDSAIRARILGTPYVTRLTDWASTYDPNNRNFTVSCKLFTAFGVVSEAPAGALISPTGALVLPLTVQPLQLAH